MLIGALQPTRIERYAHGDFSAEILLPSSSEALIDEDEFDADERLPYWAELWPAARALATLVLEESGLPARAVELGCGVGLPALAMRSRGVDVLATDYYDDALRFVEANARHNSIPPPRTLLLDWRNAPGDLLPFSLAIAADVLYESRNVEALASALETLLAPGGTFLLTDPDRVHLPEFLSRLDRTGWRILELPTREEPSPAGMCVRVRLFRIHRPKT